MRKVLLPHDKNSKTTNFSDNMTMTKYNTDFIQFKYNIITVHNIHSNDNKATFAITQPQMPSVFTINILGCDVIWPIAQ